MNIPFIQHLQTTIKRERLYEFLTIKQEMYEFLSDWAVRGVTSFLIFNLFAYGVCSFLLYEAFTVRAHILFASSIVVFSVAIQIYKARFNQLVKTGAWVHSKINWFCILLCLFYVAIFGGQPTPSIYCSTAMKMQFLDLLLRGWWQRSQSINFRLLSESSLWHSFSSLSV